MVIKMYDSKKVKRNGLGSGLHKDEPVNGFIVGTDLQPLGDSFATPGPHSPDIPVLRFVRDGLTLGWDLLTVKDLSELGNTMVLVDGDRKEVYIHE